MGQPRPNPIPNATPDPQDNQTHGHGPVMAQGPLRPFPLIGGGHGPNDPPSSHAPSPWDDWRTPRSALLTIWPERARDILAYRNPRNRTISRKLTEFLKAEMKEGRWLVNGETIIFDRDGNLCDGQHRLRAASDLNVPLSTWVVFGVDPDVFDSVDRGKVRTTSDDLSILGEKNCSNLSATLSVLWLDEHGKLSQLGDSIRSHEAREVLARHPRIRDCCSWISAHRAVRDILTPRIAAFCLYRFAEKDSAAAEKFFNDLATGANLAQGDAVLALRNILLGMKGSKSRMKYHVMLALTIKAWNHRRAGTTIKYLRWDSERENPEPFPEIK